VPLHPKLRTALDEWRAERASWPGAATNPALFLNARGGRLSVRGAYDILTGLAQEANLEVGRDADFTPHVLRHSAGTAMKMSRVASAASFGKIREQLLPATSPFGLDHGRLVGASLHAS
jgi:integrase